MGSALKLYPSGFLGSADLVQTEAVSELEKAKRVFMGGQANELPEPTASVEIQRLWTITLSNGSEVRSFEHKEEILRVALKAFGCESLLQWIHAQQTSGEYGDLHSRWIDETLEMIYQDRPRTMGYHSWSRLLTVGGNQKAKTGISDIAQRLIVEQYPRPGRTRGDVSIQELIIDWVRQPGGIDDLMASLYVLFGTR